MNSDQQDRGLKADLTIDRATAARLGITAQAIDDTLYDAFGQRQVSTMYMPLNQYHVVMEVDPEFSQNPDALRHLYVRGDRAARRSRSARSPHYARRHTPLAVNHSGQFPSVTISFNLTPGVSLGDAVEEIQQCRHDMGLPASIHGSFGHGAGLSGLAEAIEPMLILAALVTVYIVLGILYESYIHPITILSTLPSAGVGALLALLLCQHRAERDGA